MNNLIQIASQRQNNVEPRNDGLSGLTHDEAISIMRDLQKAQRQIVELERQVHQYEVMARHPTHRDGS